MDGFKNSRQSGGGMVSCLHGRGIRVPTTVVGAWQTPTRVVEAWHHAELLRDAWHHAELLRDLLYLA